jgi:hypothetical protein
VLTGVALIVAGAVLFLTAPTFLDVADDFNESRAKDMRARNLPRPITVLADLNARWGGRATMWLGRAVAAAAIVAGVVLLVRG